MAGPLVHGAAQRRLLALTRRVGPGVLVGGVTAVAVLGSLAATTVSLVVTDAPADVVPSALIIAVIVPLVVAPACSWLIVRMAFTLAAACDELHLLATTDPLTGLPNRRHFFDRAAPLLEASGATLLVAMVDIDRFKLLNDRHGHAVGDEALVALASQLQAAVGPDGIAARLGGDEFAVVVPVSDGTLAITARAVETAGGRIPTTVGGPLTASVGLRCVDAPIPIDQALHLADAALYDAKSRREGKVAR